MKDDALDPATRARMRLLAELTEPSDAELERVLARRVTRDDVEPGRAEAEATTPSWVEEQRVRAGALSDAPPGRDPRAVGWARATAPTPGELDRVVPAAPDLSLAAASAPTDDEVSRLVHGAIPEAWQAWTEPSDLEVQRLVARHSELLDRRPRGWRPGLVLGGGAAGLVAAAAAIGLTLALPADTYGTPELVLGEASTLSPTEVVDLGPSIDLSVHALPDRTAPPRVRLARADAEQTVLDVLDGGTRFVVDPGGLHRHLTVRAGDVEVVVKGTVFTVDALGDDLVAVGVERGRVQVTDPTGTRFLTAGQAWRSDVGRVATADAEPVQDSLLARSPAEPDPDPEPASDAAPAEPPSPAPAATDARRESPAPSPGSEPAGETEPTDTTEPAEEAEGSPPTDWPPRVMPGSSADDGVADTTSARTEDALDAEAQAALDAFNRLGEIRTRFRRGEDPSVVRGMLSRFVTEPEMPTNLAVAGQDLQIDVTRATGDARAFEQEVLLLEQLDPDHPTLPDLKLERGRRLLEAGYLARATRAWEEARSLPGDRGVRAIVGLADCARQAGSTNLEIDRLRQALRLANDPALADSIQQRLDALEADRRRR